MTKVMSLMEHRTMRGFSKRKLARLSGISYSTYTRIEKKVELARIEHLKSICVVLNITLDEIFFND